MVARADEDLPAITRREKRPRVARIRPQQVRFQMSLGVWGMDAPQPVQRGQQRGGRPTTAAKRDRSPAPGGLRIDLRGERVHQLSEARYRGFAAMRRLPGESRIARHRTY